MTTTTPFGKASPLVDLAEAGRSDEQYDLLTIDSGTAGEPFTVAIYLDRESGRFFLVTCDEHESIVTGHDMLSEATELYGEALASYQDFGA